jgi:hypothetical protein
MRIGMKKERAHEQCPAFRSSACHGLFFPNFQSAPQRIVLCGVDRQLRVRVHLLRPLRPNPSDFLVLIPSPKVWAMGKFGRNSGAKSPFFMPK